MSKREEMVNIISIYDSKETNFEHNGIVVLNECISCIVTEELNGLYEVCIEYPISDSGKFKFLTEENIIKADGQLFRCYHKTTTLTSRIVNCRHIFYDLADNWVEKNTLTGVSEGAILDYMLSNLQYPTDFYQGGSDTTGVSTYIIPDSNPVEAIMGSNGLIATLAGEIVRDNYSMKVIKSRGANNGVLISYGKNIKGIEETIDMDTVATRLSPTGTLENKKIYLPEGHIDSPLVGNYSHPKIKVIDFPMDVINYTVTPAITTATTVYKGASTVNNDMIAAGIATIKIITTIGNKAQITPAEKVLLNAQWQTVHTEYDLYHDRAVSWFVEPSGTYATLDDLKTAMPQGGSNIYEVTNADTVSGQKWYYWDSFTWAETGRISSQLTNYEKSYNVLKAYTEPFFDNMNVATGAVSKTTINNWTIYINARTVILTEIFNKTAISLWKIRSAANLELYVTKLRQLTRDYFTSSACDLPSPSYKVDFVELSKTEEYKNYSILETVEIGDTITVRHTKLNMNFLVKVVKVVTTVMANGQTKIESIVLGSQVVTLANNFNSTASSLSQLSNRISSLETTTAKVNSDGTITNGTIDASKVDNLTGITDQMNNSNSMTQAYMDAMNDSISQSGAVLRILGDYDANTAYINDLYFIDVIIFQNISYYCKISNTGQAPADNTGTTPIYNVNWGPITKQLDWINDWDGLKTVIGDTSIISPKIFSGINGGSSLSPILTGIAMGRDVLGGSNSQIGIVGYNVNTVTFQLKTDGSAVFGAVVGQQFIVNANGTIVTPTIIADKIVGGILALGGANNIKGQLQVYDASGVISIKLDNTGMDANGYIYANHVGGSDSHDGFYVGTGTCRINTLGGSMRLLTSAIGAGGGDVGLMLASVAAVGGMDLMVGGVSKFSVASGGTKTGGVIEIDGMNVGLSPVDSPRYLHQDILYDVEVEETGTVIQIDELFAKTLKGYAVFPSNGKVEVTKKNATSFTVKGFTGTVDFNIIGNRRDMTDQYFVMLNVICDEEE